MNATRMKHQLEVTTPEDREIAMTRVFDAPAHLVFDAFTKPELVSRWLLGPDGWSMPVCEIDLKPGGAYWYRWRNDTDGREFGFRGTYHEVTAPARIVHSERFDDPSVPGEALITDTFVERDGVTTVVMTIRYASKAERDEALETGMESGVATSYDRLAVLLERP